MHCPNCGQQQASDAVKFCSRCGFDIALVPELLSNAGKLASRGVAGGAFLTRRVISFLSVSLIMLAIFAGVIINVVWHRSDLAPIVAVGGFITGAIGLMAANFLLPSDLGRRSGIARKDNVSPDSWRGELPPSHSIPAEDYMRPSVWNAPTTNDLAPVGVTDETTKLLEKEK
jgi:hypothetical protein